MTAEPIVIFITTPNREEAARLADMLVGARLAGCVQILPEIESVYRWEGKVERQPEILLLAKSTRDKFDELERQVRAIHSYETPEIVAVPAAAVSEPYLKWLIESLVPAVYRQAAS
ncbi:MAG TPA: divalent-cation tolerance protein CutA [Pyrinomonadaceae bacterium]|jgi:periplasmic divalent cation tolerance protein|nr:divalent-cation tolerance protein CutA [Pyrinomonadaceae bacterium]